MSEAEQLSLLIGEIYDAALDPTLWPRIQGHICEFVHGHASTLYWQDSVRQTGNVYYQVGISPDYERLYFEKYISMNPLYPALTFLEVGGVYTVADLLPYEEMRKTLFYKEWLRPQGLLDVAFSNLEKSAATSIVFTIIRQERDGIVDDEMLRHLRLIMPHIRRAALIGKVIDLKTLESASMADSLDGIVAGIFIVDANAHIAHANASGHAMLADGSLLRSQNGKLAANDPEAERALHNVFAAAGGGDIAVGVRGFAVPLTARDGERYVAHALPLTSGARRQAGIAYAATAAVFVTKAMLKLPSPTETIAKVYKLTPSEVRVLLAVVEIGGLPAVADTLGISKETVKTQLNSVFSKTNTHRQIDLVKLVAGYISPLIR
jgi:DNA-binding CsgD family transcriptional regulator